MVIASNESKFAIMLPTLLTSPQGPTMPLHANNELLKATIEAMPLFAGRYQNPVMMNYPAPGAPKRGSFSLVFKALDQTTGNLVALKFFDVDPMWAADKYRRDSFEREHTILEKLVDATRCLQVQSPFETYLLPVPTPTGGVPQIVCNYFAVEWVEDDIDSFFWNIQAYEAIARIEVFRKVVLSVHALHGRGVFHRDLKVDNFRQQDAAVGGDVIAIDLGTAALMDSKPIGGQYLRPAGAQPYASPEALCGLAGDRTLATYTDVYALGCLLFELFNSGLYFYALHAQNPNLGAILHAIATEVAAKLGDLDTLHRALNRYGAGFTPANAAGPGTQIPPGLKGILGGLVSKATQLDYRKRVNLEEFLRLLQSSMLAIRNEALYQKTLRDGRAARAKRQQKILAQEARLAARKQVGP